jgi:hypothetical protein
MLGRWCAWRKVAQAVLDARRLQAHTTRLHGHTRSPLFTIKASFDDMEPLDRFQGAMSADKKGIDADAAYVLYLYDKHPASLQAIHMH